MYFYIIITSVIKLFSLLLNVKIKRLFGRWRVSDICGGASFQHAIASVSLSVDTVDNNHAVQTVI